MMHKKAIVAVCGAALLAAATGALWTGKVRAPWQDTALETEQQQLSYALGMNQAAGLKNNAIEVDVELYNRGFKDALAGDKTLLTKEQARLMLTSLKQKQIARQRDEARALGAKNTGAGEAFLAANKENNGVVTLESGLQYKVVKAGNGKKPTIDDIVVVNYRGMLIDGTEFDTTAKRGPVNLPVNKVIKGWSEALQLMPVGSTWQLVIPSDLAYGERPANRLVGPNATVIFDVELLDIKEGTAQTNKRETMASNEKPRHSATRR